MMKNLFVCRSLIRVAVIMVVMAFMASQGTDTYAIPPLKLDQHDAEIKAAITQHDIDATNDLIAHDGNMTTEHDALSVEIEDHDTGVNTKLDEILGGECPDCPDAWDKLLTDDRFELVMNGAGVLDHETCLVWEQSPDTTTRTWTNALLHCFQSEVGGRGGWRLPTIEELASLKDTVNTNPSLPSGHPFDTNAVQSSFYWSSTTNAFNATFVWGMSFVNGTVNSAPKSNVGLVWCVRGGQGHDAY